MTNKYDKESLRNYIRAKKDSYSIDDLKSKSVNVISLLEKMPSFVKSNVVLLYNSLPDEVNTTSLIEKYLKTKKILLPSVYGDYLVLHEYNLESKILNGKYGIGESDGKIFTDYDSIDIAIIPGMAFDVHMNRLGRGRGYYDRILPFIRCEKVGICFDFQLVSHVPTDSHDYKVDTVISENTILNGCFNQHC